MMARVEAGLHGGAAKLNLNAPMQAAQGSVLANPAHGADLRRVVDVMSRLEASSATKVRSATADPKPQA